MNKEPYNHAEINSRGQFVWSDHRLVQRYVDLEETQKVPHNELRRKVITHEMACIAFELVMRELDEQKREHEIATLEALYALELPEERVEDEQGPDTSL